MHERCEYNGHCNYASYGGRGISVCEEWSDFNCFYNWAIQNGYSDKLTIDRRDVNKGYSPDNCRFVTRIEQANNKRNSVYISFNGESHTYAEWERISGIGRKTIMYRIKHGWTPELALTTPAQHHYT